MNYDNVIACRYFGSLHVQHCVTLAKQWVMYHLFHCANTPYKFFVTCHLTCLLCVVGIYLCDKEKSTFTKIHPIPDLFEPTNHHRNILHCEIQIQKHESTP